MTLSKPAPAPAALAERLEDVGRHLGWYPPGRMTWIELAERLAASGGCHAPSRAANSPTP
jgi:hypothetical protein